MSRSFDIVRLRENIRLGQRVDAFAIDTWNDGNWKEFAKGTSIGACRLLKGTMASTSRVRLRIVEAAACPAISEFALFARA